MMFAPKFAPTNVMKTIDDRVVIILDPGMEPSGLPGVFCADKNVTTGERIK